jgi:hypothetical protein
LESRVPRTRVLFFQEAAGNVPVVEWIRELRRRDGKVYAKCVAAIERLAELGHELRRPLAEYLRDGIYELRPKSGHVNYRILYFFHGQNVAVLASGLTKEREVPPGEIDRAIARKRVFETVPNGHSYEEAAENSKPH